MKKNIFALVALSLLPLVSCEKEVDIIPEEKPAETISGDVIKIVARISDDATRTNYDSDGKFTWDPLDEIVVIAHVDGNANNQKNFTFTTSAGDITDEGRTATFTGTVESGYTVDYAAYPTSLASDHTSSGYNAPFVKVPSNASGAISSAILIGVSDGEGGYNFNTAMSLFKINISGVPASASKIRLVTRDKKNYPLDGDFTLVESAGVVTLDFAHYHPEWRHYYMGYLDVDISSRGAIDGEDFYFNVPIGTYPARTLSIQVLDGSDNVMDEKVIAKALTTNRNECLALPALTMDCNWEILGNAKFHDMFYLDNVKLDSWNWVTVVLQQKTSDHNQYRLVNPYKLYSTANGYTTLYEPDYFLYFTVDPATDLVSFERHITGLTFSDKRYVISHTDKNGGHMYTQAYSKVVSKDGSGNPLCVQLAPYYLYSDFSNGYSRTDKNGMVMILFPDYEDSCSLSSDNDADDESVTIKASGTNISKIKVGISSSSASDAMTDIKTTDINSLPGTIDAATGAVLSDINTTGKYYIAVKGYDGDGREIVRTTDIIYHITSDDLTAMSGNYWIQNSSSYPLSIGLSTNIFMGNLAFTGYSPWSLTGNIAGVYDGSTFVVDATQVFTKHSNGKYYGLYNPKNANTIDNMTFTVSTVDGKKQLAISGICVGEATVSENRAISYGSTSVYFSSSPVLYQQ